MAIISGVTIDYTLSPRIILVPVPDENGVTVSIADLQDTLQDLEDNEDSGIVYPRLRDCSGGVALGGGRFTGYTMTLNNAQVMFAGQTSPEATGAASADDAAGKILTDATAHFLSGIDRGAKVFNWTSRAMSVVTEVISDTQLRHRPLSGGDRATWLTTDEYRIYATAKCVLTGGNLTAADEYGADLDPVMKSSNVYVQMESATSAALVGMEAVGEEVAGAVWDEPLADHAVPGSLAANVRSIRQAALAALGK